MTGLNWRAVNRKTGQCCGHKHHSKESAERCADVLGWDRYYVETFDAGRHKCVKTHMGSKKYKCVNEYNKRTGVVLATQVSPETEINIGDDE